MFMQSLAFPNEHSLKIVYVAFTESHMQVAESISNLRTHAAKWSEVLITHGKLQCAAVSTQRGWIRTPVQGK